jgi:CBS domain-containing protein
MTMRTLLEAKSKPAMTINADAKLTNAAQKMVAEKVGSLLVNNANQATIGIITERDILRFCAEQADKLAITAVSEVMTQDLVVATLETTVDEAQVLMTEHRFRHLPVMDGNKVVGIISIGDLVKARLRETAVEVKYLRDFINL